MKVGIATDHGGYALKQIIQSYLTGAGHEVVDFGAHELDELDDYPDFVIPLANAVRDKKVERGIAICGSGVGACITANKIQNVRASLITDHFSAHQGVEDDDMNTLCLGARITGSSLAIEIVESFLKAKFRNEGKYLRRLLKVKTLEND
ncbi:MAG: RpiB/LacA/LacB family sugar-phosphate isomerase [Flavitalea sp.]